jgi:hypothetical protein
MRGSTDARERRAGMKDMVRCECEGCDEGGVGRGEKAGAAPAARNTPQAPRAAAPPQEGGARTRQAGTLASRGSPASSAARPALAPLTPRPPCHLGMPFPSRYSQHPLTTRPAAAAAAGTRPLGEPCGAWGRHLPAGARVSSQAPLAAAPCAALRSRGRPAAPAGWPPLSSISKRGACARDAAAWEHRDAGHCRVAAIALMEPSPQRQARTHVYSSGCGLKERTQCIYAYQRSCRYPAYHHRLPFCSLSSSPLPLAPVLAAA